MNEKCRRFHAGFLPIEQAKRRFALASGLEGRHSLGSKLRGETRTACHAKHEPWMAAGEEMNKRYRQLLVSGALLFASIGYIIVSYAGSASFYDQRFYISVVGMVAAVAAVFFFAALMPSSK
jgi:hypothetical protein